jgi:hypothetical protein
MIDVLIVKVNKLFINVLTLLTGFLIKVFLF